MDTHTETHTQTAAYAGAWEAIDWNLAGCDLPLSREDDGRIAGLPCTRFDDCGGIIDADSYHWDALGLCLDCHHGNADGTLVLHWSDLAAPASELPCLDCGTLVDISTHAAMEEGSIVCDTCEGLGYDPDGTLVVERLFG